MRFREKRTEEYTGGRSTGRPLPGPEDDLRPNIEHVGAERASITCQERESDSPYVETIMHGRTLSDDSPVRPAECHWHMVFVRKDGKAWVVFVGPWTTAGIAHYAEGAEILWIKFKLGAFMPHLPTREVSRRGDGPARCFESVLLAEGVRVEIPRSRERGDVRRQARAQTGCWFATRSWTPCCEADHKSCRPGRCGTASCGPPG